MTKKSKESEELVNTPDIIQEPESQLENIQAELDLARQDLEKTKIEIEEKKIQLKNMPVAVIDKQITHINESKASEDLISQLKAYDNVKVTGKFMNRRSPGQMVKLPYIKYADDPIKWWHFYDGGTYTIPRGFADQINEYYHTPKFIEKDGAQVITDSTTGDNTSISHVDTSNKKYAFVPIAF